MATIARAESSSKQPEGPLRIGIDAGSKTVKLVVLDAQDNLVYHTYSRHKSNVRETLAHVIHGLRWMKGDLCAEFCMTGSAGIGAAQLLGIPFVQEVIATDLAVERLHPETDAVIELGGEDAKVIYRTGGLEQRMNATCAGGTGGFLDTVAFMLGLRTQDLSTVARGYQHIYPIASRCAVFAQTDIRPLMNQGATKADIAASALDAVVRQTLGGLACGRPITGNVLFLGGPLEFNPELVTRFRAALHLDRKKGVKPAHAQLYPAIGAALAAGGAADGGKTGESASFSLGELEALLDDATLALDADGIDRLPPLFESEADLQSFRERHGRAVYPTKRLFDAQGPLFMGIDCGSTTVKMAVIDQEGTLLYNDYRSSRGEAIEAVRDMLLEFWVGLPASAPAGAEPPYIAHACATGYGESLLISGFGVDSGVVETTAHARAARHICPDATFVLDIGGQDMKALWLRGPYVADAVLNEACSSGCGAFVDGTAHGLGSNKYRFAEAALGGRAPVDLGTRCTVFMSSRVKQAQKAGASFEDIAAGVAYSVVQNVLYRIIGRDRLHSLGDRVVVQGGTFKSDAVLRAFEMVCGVEAVRSDRAHLMGAIGAALVGRDRALSQGLGARSALIGREEAQAVAPTRRARQCELCGNGCTLAVVEFGNGRTMVTGNRCERGAAAMAGTADPSPGKAPVGGRNLIAEEQRQLARYGSAAGSSRASVAVGIMDAFESYRHRPFWHTLLVQLGFKVLVPDADPSPEVLARAWETVPAESLCFPAKLAHGKAVSLMDQGADALFMVQARRGNHCAVACGYAAALIDAMEPLRLGRVAVAAPVLSSPKPGAIIGDNDGIAALREALAPLCEQAGEPLSTHELEEALQAAAAEQGRFQEAMAKRTDDALAQLEADPSAKAVLLVGRPYHMDPRILHGIDAMEADLGFTVLSDAGLAPHLGASVHRSDGGPEWRPAKHLLKAARFVLGHPQVELVCLQSFGCGYDAMSLEEVRTLLEQGGRPFTALKVDEMVETAHIRIRLRTLAESIEARRRMEGAVQSEKAAPDCSGCGLPDPPACEDAPQVPLAPGSGRCVRALEQPLGPADLAVARSSTVKDICFTANGLAARVIRLMDEDPALETVVLPEVCKACLNEAIPRMVERACGRIPRIIWEPPALSQGRSDRPGADPATERAVSAPGVPDASPRPKIGILGNPLLCFDPFMNDGILALLEDLGCEAVLPDEAALCGDDVSYTDQLQHFYDSGVRQVIYLQSFGCVKAHVQARGAHYRNAARFPGMSITVLDYDPEASALNRENRIRLIASAARLSPPS